METWTVDEDGLLRQVENVWNVDTGSVLVPEHRGKEHARSIRIPVRRIRSPSGSEGIPIFWLSGGPGQSNMSSFTYDHFIGDHDHVEVGYRGVDGQVSLDCPEVVAVMEEGGDILSPEMRREIAAAYQACAARLMSDSVELDGYTALEVARDVDDVRRILGYERIIIVAESYGTRIAYYYSQLFADHLERMVLLGSNPPGRMVWDPFMNDRLIRRYARLWRSDKDAHERHPDLVEAIRSVESDFPERWMFMPIHKGTVRASMNAFLFHTETAARVFDVYVAASHGDASGLWLFSVVGSMIFPTSVNWGDNAAKAVSADYRAGIDYASLLDPEDALFGAPLGAFLWSAAQDADWPVTTLPKRFHAVHVTDVPTLFISGSLDLSTPAENVANDLLPKFPRGRHVVISEAGHVMDIWRSQPRAVRDLVRSFLRGEEPDTTGLVYKPVSFEVSWGFPILAKITVVGILLIVSIVIMVLAYGIRRIMRLRSVRQTGM